MSSFPEHFFCFNGAIGRAEGKQGGSIQTNTMPLSLNLFPILQHRKQLQEQAITISSRGKHKCEY